MGRPGVRCRAPVCRDTYCKPRGIRQFDLYRSQHGRSLAADSERTTYLLDVRTPEEFAAVHLPNTISSEGRPVARASPTAPFQFARRVVLVDDHLGTRARPVAHWFVAARLRDCASIYKTSRRGPGQSVMLPPGWGGPASDGKAPGPCAANAEIGRALRPSCPPHNDKAGFPQPISAPRGIVMQEDPIHDRPRPCLGRATQCAIRQHRQHVPAGLCQGPARVQKDVTCVTSFPLDAVGRH